MVSSLSNVLVCFFFAYEVELQSSTISLASSGVQTSDFPSHGDLISLVCSFETLTTNTRRVHDGDFWRFVGVISMARLRALSSAWAQDDFVFPISSGSMEILAITGISSNSNRSSMLSLLTCSSLILRVSGMQITAAATALLLPSSSSYFCPPSVATKMGRRKPLVVFF